ncbi:MAG: hypothetical protein ABIP38_06480 [Steroidobacteraceae bacterium]
MQLLQEYTARIGRAAPLLREDCAKFRPLPGTYSPYGVVFGFSSNLLELMAMKTLQPDAATRFGLEDVFADMDASAGKLVWVSSWRKLPHISPEVLQLYDYPQSFADAMFDRVEQALRCPAATGSAVPTGHFSIVDSLRSDTLPVAFVLSSDPQAVAAGQAVSCDQPQLLQDRLEGMFLVSYQTAGGWTAITKDVLTQVLGAGRDVSIVGLPRITGGILKLMCPALVAS